MNSIGDAVDTMRYRQIDKDEEAAWDYNVRIDKALHDQDSACDWIADSSGIHSDQVMECLADFATALSVRHAETAHRVIDDLRIRYREWVYARVEEDMR